MTTLQIHIGGLSDSAARVRAAVARFEAGETVAEAHLAFESWQGLAAVLSDARLALLRRVHGAGATDLPTLARALGREEGAVRADVDALADAGLLDRAADGTLTVGYDRLEAGIAL